MFTVGLTPNFTTLDIIIEITRLHVIFYFLQEVYYVIFLLILLIVYSEPSSLACYHSKLYFIGLYLHSTAEHKACGRSSTPRVEFE
jgi:hypothetical protein